MSRPKVSAGDISQDQVEIRTATAKDLPSIVDLDAKSTGEAKSRYWRQLYDHFEQNRATGRAFLVAEQGGRVIGFITGEIRAFEFGGEPCGWVFSLDVDQDRRAHSVGTKLFESLCDTFRSAGVSKVRTMLERSNHLVLDFFRGQGMMAGPFIQLEKDLD